MKKIFSIFILFVFISCDNELDINDEWQDIPVLYAILNSGVGDDIDLDGQDDLNYNHFVRVQKSFLGTGSAYDYASISDSIYYNPEDLVVFLQLVKDGVPQTEFELDLVVDSVLREDYDLFKEDGVFYDSNHYLYKFPSLASDLIPFDDEMREFKISVLNKLSGDTAFAQTNIVRPMRLTQPRSTGGTSIIQWGNGYGFNIKIKASTNAKMYATSLRFNYIEQSKDDYLYDVAQGNPLPTTLSDDAFKYVEWTLSDVLANDNQLNASANPPAGSSINLLVSPGTFFEFIQTQISEQDISNPDFYRYPLNSVWMNSGDETGVISGMYHGCIDLNITAVNSELYTYLQANAPTTGLNQERPGYNNIVNGIGHVSSRSVLNMNNLRINQSTMDSISFGEITQNLNFACYKNINGIVIDFGFDCQED
ncbi:MAG: hypothetical protein CMD23_01730 [Flavobacteriales bacterium]|nr:hypothetical protein [Flavobacteriales bacterium]